MIYLLKASLVWGLLLLLFEVFYKRNGRFGLNRLYLLAALGAGLLLPLVSLPVRLTPALPEVRVLYPAVAQAAPAAAQAVATLPAETGGVGPWQLLGILYALGVAFMLARLAAGFGHIRYLVRRNPAGTIDGHKVHITGKDHAPFSFMGRIFIGHPESFPGEELTYIIRHEAAHNRQRHWLDLLLLQLACTMLWFHPLVWRIRYLLRLQHEYEADELAAGSDAYAYGHFLLQQTLLKGVPAFAPSFHFSPIKNRIRMLTKRKNQKAGAWKYLLVVPSLLACSLLIARSAVPGSYRIRQGDVTTYNGNTFSWHTLEVVLPGNVKYKRPAIYEMNGEPVYRVEQLKQLPANYLKEEEAYNAYLQEKFTAAFRNTRDSVTKVYLSHIVINKQGRVVYYDVQYIKPYASHTNSLNYWKPYPDPEPEFDAVVEKIVAAGPSWQPAMLNGQAVNSYYSPAGC